MTGKLSQEDIELLLTKTKFSKADILEWFEVFKKECPKGFLQKEMVIDMFESKGAFKYYFILFRP